MAELRTLTQSRQQRVLLRLLSCAYTTPSWVLTPGLLGHHCVEEGLSEPEAARLAEDVIAADVTMYAVDVQTDPATSQTTTTHRPLGTQDAVGQVRAHLATEGLREQARRAAQP